MEDRKSVVISHLVDPDSRLFEGRKKFVQSKFKNSPDCVQDVRKVLDNKDVDVISIATPNHWHSLMSIWACQAKKAFMWRNPSVIIFLRDANSLRPPRSTNVSSNMALKTDP